MLFSRQRVGYRTLYLARKLAALAFRGPREKSLSAINHRGRDARLIIILALAREIEERPGITRSVPRTLMTAEHELLVLFPTPPPAPRSTATSPPGCTPGSTLPRDTLSWQVGGQLRLPRT